MAFNIPGFSASFLQLASSIYASHPREWRMQSDERNLRTYFGFPEQE